LPEGGTGAAGAGDSCAGVAGAGVAGAGAAGVAGVDEAGTEAPVRTERSALCWERSTSAIEVSMKTIADQVVALLRTVELALGPNTVWVPPPPPKALAMSALFPVWSRTTRMRKRQTTTWTARTIT